MSLAQCLDLVAAGDPERHAVTRAATAAAQARLYPVYALNLEIGRAAWASAEPMVAEMRLQWWRDAVAALGQGGAVPAHPVLEACGFLAGDAEAAAVWDALCEARRWDIWKDPFADDAALWGHLDATGGAVMWLAARALGAGPGAEAAVRDFGAAAALAAWFRAIPELEARGRLPLPDGRAPAVTALARAGLARIARARAARAGVPGACLPALLTGWQAPGLLAQAARAPGRVAAGQLRLSAARRGATLTLRALSGRW
jgi:phytoene/squalene synthetase